MNRIICATDYSENSITALKYAYSISKKLNTNLMVTHVFNFPALLKIEFEENFIDNEKETYKQQHLKLKKFCILHLGDDLDEMNVTIEVIENSSAFKGIISKADEIKAFMIVVGIKGTNILKEVMGSTTRQLINKAPCLVLAIPEYIIYKEIDTIVYATDFEAEADIEVIKKLSKIAKAFEAKIQVVHITTEKEYEVESQMDLFKDKLKKKVDYENIKFKILVSDDVFNTLRMYLEEIEADIVVMLEREKRGLLSKLFHGDLVKKMETYGKLPLLSFNEDNFGEFYFIDFY